MSKGPVDLRLLRFARAHRGRLAWLITLSVAHALTVVAAAVTAAHLVVAIFSGLPWAGSFAVLASSLALGAAVTRLRPVAAHRVATGVIATAREQVLGTVAARGSAWVAGRAARPEPVDVAGLLATGLDPLRPWFAAYLPSLVVAVVLPPSVLAVMAWADTGSALVVALTLPLVPLFAALVGWATQYQAKTQYDRGGHLAGHFLDVVRGLVTLKLVDRAHRQVQAVRESSQRYARSTTRVLSVAFLSSTALDLVATVSVGLVAVGAGVRLAGGEMALWPALAVILLAPEAYRPLREAGAQFHESAQASAVLDQLAALEQELPGASAEAPTGGGGASAEAAEGGGDASAEAPTDGGSPVTVGMYGAHITYPGRRAPVVLPDVQVGAGELAVVSGPSGAGKTTLLRVLAGAQPLDSGAARVEGEAHYVPQRPGLPLARTVREALNAEEHHGAGADDQAAAVLAALGLPAADLEYGLDTPLGDDGAGLSAGQRHRIALARAVLAVTGPRAPRYPVLLLDEPTAHLDAETEAAVVTCLQSLTGRGVTVVAAAHRSPILDVADRTITISSSAETRPAGRAPGGEPARRGEPAETRGPATPDEPVTRPPKLLARSRRWWAALPPRTRFVLAAVAGAASVLSGVGLTVAASWMIIRAEARPPILTLSMAVVAVRGFAIARPLLGYAQRLAAHDAGLSLLASWRARVVADLLPRVPGRLTERRGRLLTRVVHDVDTRLSGIVAGQVPLAAAVTALAVVAAVLAWVVPVALVPLAGAVVVAGILVPWWALRADRRSATARDQAQAELHDAVIAAVENADELSGPRGGRLLTEVRRRAGRADDVEAGEAQVDGRSGGAGEVGGAILALGAVLAAGALWHAGAMSAELLGILILGAMVLTDPLLSILPAVREAGAGARARDRLAELRAPAKPVIRAAVSARPEAGPVTDHSSSGHTGLQVSGVVAGWQETTTLRGLDLHLDAGEVVLIEGESGSGKSTLAAVLVGLLAPRTGQIRLDGVAIEDVGDRQWRTQVALAGEPDHIFASTVRQNLLLARPQATDSELDAALATACLGSWYRGLERGLDTWLDSGGRVLSGGERRRLVLARALLRRPRVLILDEPTEGLDADAASRLLSSLIDQAGAQGQMLVIFSHRLDGLEQVHRRYHMDAGRLARGSLSAQMGGAATH